jgi:ABC-type Fe3+/spermidine/putrescine transport system ATPase subunit
VRPETIELVKAIDEDSLKASVVERSFLGEKVDYLLELDGHSIYATSYDPLRHGTFSLHQEVGVRFNPNAINILKEVER